MAPSRLTDSQKQELLERYRAGETSAALAEAFGCSTNTVSRTVRTLLTPEEYSALKSSRSRGASVAPQAKAVADTGQEQDLAIEPLSAAMADQEVESADVSEQAEDDSPSTLALDDADDFGADEPEEISDDEDLASDPGDIFHEVAVLPVDLPQVSREQISCLPFAVGVLPESVYMLVDKTVELDPRPLSEFPELGVADPSELSRQALCLYASPRTAKRQCGRSQRVIKVPDTQVFERTTRHLVARGITRLVMEGALYSLDS